MISEDDINAVTYFWEEKRNLDRWCDWQERKEDFVKEFPELIKAWDDYRTSVRIMDAVVRSLSNSGSSLT